MSLDIWLAFLIATAVILVIPGPTVLLVITQAISHGRRSVVPLAAGVVCGDFTAMTLSLLGMGALLAASAALFGLFKWIGAAYLFYLGIKLWRAEPSSDSTTASEEQGAPRLLFRHAFVVTALNPKSIAFFVAFLPQFISASKPLGLQLLILEATFVSLAGLNAALYALFAGRLQQAFRQPRTRRWLNRCGGGALLGAGAATAAMRSS